MSPTSYLSYGSTPPQVHMSPALESLAKTRCIEVEEKSSMIEAATDLLGWDVEMANKYRIYATDGKKTEIMYAVEQTNCCTRNVRRCCPDCTPWELSILHTERGGADLAFTLRRPWSATCCCFNRPVVHIRDEVTGHDIGSIKDPFACFDLTFSLRDPLEKEVLQAKGGCCQPGLLCPLPCGPCSEVHLDVVDASGEHAAIMTKKVPSCLKWVFASDVDNYKIDYQNVADPRMKALVLALSIFVDFRYFNDNQDA